MTQRLSLVCSAFLVWLGVVADRGSDGSSGFSVQVYLNLVCPAGYSVGSGEFLGDGETYYIAGAPRAALAYGKVRRLSFTT